MAKEVENWQAHDPAWEEEKKDIPKGQFDRWGVFVYEDCLWEVASEQVFNESITRGSFLEKVLEYIESNEDAKEKFLKWFYPDYEKE